MEITLRKTTADDRSYIFWLEQAEENRPFITPWTEDKHRQAITDPDCFHAIIQGQAPAGFLFILGLTSPHRCIEFGRIVVEQKKLDFLPDGN
jgi:hypothetical protein